MSVESSLKNPRSGCSLSLLAFGVVCGVGIAALGGILLSMAPGYWREMQEVWTETQGVVMGAGVKTRDVRTGNQAQQYHYSKTHTVVLDCRYEVNGKEFTSKELVAPKQAKNTSDADEARKVAEEYNLGEVIAVFHHPTEPEKARLEPNAPKGMFVLSAIFGPVVMLAGIGLGWWVWAEWRAKIRAQV